MKRSIRDIVYQTGSLKAALPLIAREGHPDEIVDAIREVVEALSGLQRIRGKQGDRARISKEKTAEIKRLLLEGKSMGQAAKLTGVSTATVHRHAQDPDVQKFYRAQREQLAPYLFVKVD